MEFTYLSGQSPIDPDERAGPIPQHITTMGELNDLEAANIAEAVIWLQTVRNPDPLSSEFLRTLHQKMLGQVWRWAGQYRRSDKNIGGPWHEIPMRVEELLRDVKYQVKEKALPPDEIAVRFHHKLVCIHPFPNGNGRHTRMAADILVTRVLGRPIFTWGATNLVRAGPFRDTYIAALVSATAQDIKPLLDFVRS